MGLRLPGRVGPGPGFSRLYPPSWGQVEVRPLCTEADTVPAGPLLECAPRASPQSTERPVGGGAVLRLERMSEPSVETHTANDERVLESVVMVAQFWDYTNND